MLGEDVIYRIRYRYEYGKYTICTICTVYTLWYKYEYPIGEVCTDTTNVGVAQMFLLIDKNMSAHTYTSTQEAHKIQLHTYTHRKRQQFNLKYFSPHSP